MKHSAVYLREVAAIAALIEPAALERLAAELERVRAARARLYVIGLGGSAANASHAAADFRNLCGIDAVAAGDNLAEFTACANDRGWPEAFDSALQFAMPGDALLVLSVGGGTAEISVPLVRAIDMARGVGLRVLGLCGRDGGELARRGDCVLVVPTVEAARVTPHTEAFQGVLLHCLASHPVLQRRATTW